MNTAIRLLATLVACTIYGVSLTAAQTQKTNDDQKRPVPISSTMLPTPSATTTPSSLTGQTNGQSQTSTSSSAALSTTAISTMVQETVIPTQSSTTPPDTTRAPSSPALTSTTPIEPITGRSSFASLISLINKTMPTVVTKTLLNSASHEEQLRQLLSQGELDATSSTTLNEYFAGATTELVNKGKDRHKDYIPKRVTEIFTIGHSKNLVCNVDDVNALEAVIKTYSSDCQQALSVIEKVKHAMAEKLQKSSDEKKS